MMKRTLALLFLSVLTCILSALPAAATTIYSYTGADFNLLNSSDPNYSYDTADRLTFDFTLTTALASGVTTDLINMPIDWVASDGKYTFGGAGVVGTAYYAPGAIDPVYVFDAILTTDSSGNITGWSFSLYNGAHASSAYSQSNPFYALSSEVYDYIYSRPDHFGVGMIEYGAVTTAGSWTVTNNDTVPVPEPSTVISIGFGLTLLLAGSVLAGQRSRPGTR